jgi:predicted transcriptional regulator of viral defense system
MLIFHLNKEGLQMLFRDYISQNQVFLAAEMLAAVGTASSARVALSRAVKSGRALKVRTGLYVSQVGRFQDVTADPYLIASTLCNDIRFVYHSALELHGLAHSTSSLVQFMTNKLLAVFSFQNIMYKSLTARSNVLLETLSARAYGTVSVTTREQTLVDCMTKVGLGGGIEEVIRSFAGLPYVNIDAIMFCLKTSPSSVAARVGWYLEANQERWSVPDKVLTTIERRVSRRASYKLDPAYKKFADYHARWHLNLPVTEGELMEWMEL